MEILVLHPGALGDIILSLPALHLLRNRYPHARITVAANLDYLTAVASGYADRLLSLSTVPLHQMFGNEPLSPEVLRFWKAYDRIVSWTGAGNPLLSARLAETGAEVRITAWRPTALRSEHVARIFVETLYPWIPAISGIEPAKIQVDPSWSRSAESWLLDRDWHPGDRLLAMHPGAGSSTKRWPVEDYGLLARSFLEEKHGPLVIIEGPAEPGLSEHLASSLAPLKPLRAQCLNLTLLAGILSHCQMYLGNDSGISHLAAGLGIPSVVLFIATSADQWAPPGIHVKAVSCDSLDRIPPSVVRSALGF